MTFPEEWAWIEDLPEAWVPPQELMLPTDNPRLNLPIQMLASSTVGNDVIELIGQFVTQGAAFSRWHGAVGNRTKEPRELAMLSLRRSEGVRNVFESWKKYLNAFEAHEGVAIKAQ